MDQKDVKKREVKSFDEFVDSLGKAGKVVMLKAGENAHPGAHKIKAYGGYVRHDANAYKAFGIEHNEDEANVNDRMNANRVHIFDQTKDDRVQVITQGKSLGEGNSALDVTTNVQTGVTLEESVSYNLSDLDRSIEKSEEETDK